MTSSCLSTPILLLLGVRSCGGHRGLGPRFWACFGSPFSFISLLDLNRISIVVLGRTHFRSQVGFRGVFSSLKRTPSARLIVRYSRAVVELYILGWLTSSCLSTAMLMLLLEPSVFQRGRGGGTNLPLNLRSHRSHLLILLSGLGLLLRAIDNPLFLFTRKLTT